MNFKRTVKKKRTGWLIFLLSLTIMSSGIGVVRGADLPDDSDSKADTVVFRAEGKASYYARKFHGKRTSSGEQLDNNGYMAAHPSLPYGTVLRITNKKNGKSVLVRVSDRFRPSGNHLVDITRRAAEDIEIMREGLASITMEVLRPDVARNSFNPDTVTQVLVCPPVCCPVPDKAKCCFPERLDYPEAAIIIVRSYRP